MNDTLAIPTAFSLALCTTLLGTSSCSSAPGSTLGPDSGADTATTPDGGPSDAGSRPDHVAPRMDAAPDGPPSFDSPYVDVPSGDSAQSDSSSDAGEEGGTPAGTYAFLGGQALSILDATNPASLAVVGSYASKTQGLVIGVAVSGGLTYISTSIFGGGSGDGGDAGPTGGGFDILDTSVIASPAVVSSFDLEGSGAFVGPVVLSGRYAFVGEANEIEVVDVGTPTSPAHAARVTVDGLARWLVINGTTLYAVVDHGSGNGGDLVVVDITKPTAPTTLSTTTLSATGATVALAVEGSDAYLIDLQVVTDGGGETSELLAYDVSSPASPTWLSTFPVKGGLSIAAQSGYAYIAGSGLTVVDVHDPANPKAAGAGTVHSPTTGVIVGPDPSKIYVVGSDTANPQEGMGSLEVFDVTTPSTPTSLGYYLTLPGGAYTAEAVAALP